MNPKKPAGQSKAKPAAKERAATPPAQSEAFPVVGIGASAGGLEAFRQLLDHLPVDTGMAFVLVQHLDPTHDSILTELLSRSTRMPVSEVTDGMAVEPDHVYVIPRNTNMAIAEGVLRLLPREEARGRHRPIDYFLRTLAADQSHRAIGVILSGTASDGTLGLEAIKAEGGITFAQDVKSAKYDSMPRSAIAAGHVDFILTPEGIAQELARISRHPYVTPPAAAAQPVEEETQPTGRNGFRKILMLLRKAKGVDFSDYKANTLHRRITRRMVLNKLESMENYARLLRENAAEVEALYQDILINVTSFFRNPETFAVLKERIFPKVARQRTPDEPIRIWTLGCSTGEEAYSIAMSFVEFAGDHGDHIPVQIFATDLSDRGIEKARAGLYSKDIAEDVSPERLHRFFTEAEGGYRVSKPIRDMVVFARQNVLADPPFSRLDLISCRNLLIYLEPVLQKQVLPTLHYALRPAGILWLGSSETVGAASDLFTPEEKKHRFYSRKPAAARLHFQATRGEAARQSAGPGQKTNYVSDQLRGEHDAEKEADRILLARYSPASVLVNANLDILQFRGSTGAYLEPPAGKATLNLLKMAREGLMLPLRAAIQKAKKDDATVRKEGVRVNYDGESRQVSLEVVPIKGLAANERSFLVLFEQAAQPKLSQETAAREAPAGRTKRKIEERQVARLQDELAAAREYMQSLVEQQEAANEELQSSSEEIQSSNEELQSINEELETAKEELESSNEELATLNDELHNRNQELTTLNDDLNNLHDSINIPILMLGRDLRIRRFTPQAEKALSLIATDVGRPISDIQPQINVPDLEALIAEVIDTVSVKEREVQDRQGRWYLMRVRPYKTRDNRIDGAVVVLLDIDALKRSEAEISAARDYAEAIVRTARDPFLILNAGLRVHTANEAFYSLFKVSPAEAEGRLIYELGNRQWDIPRLRELLEDILPRNSFFNNFEVTHEFESIGRHTMLLNARRLDDTGGQPARILLGIQDVTELLHFQAASRQSQARYQALVQASAQIVWTTDAGGAVVEDSPSWRAFTGQTYEQWKGLGWLDALHPDDRERVSELWQRAVAERTPVETEYRIRHTSGDWRWTVARAVPVLNSDGSVREWGGMNSDITERQQAEAALREIQEELRRNAEAFSRLVDQAPFGIYVVDSEFRLKQVNAGAQPAFRNVRPLAGRDFGEAIRIIWPEPFASEVIDIFRRTLETGEPYLAPSLTEQRHDVDVVESYEWQIHRVTLADGQFGVVCYFFDATRLRQAEQALRESEERLRQAQAVAHVGTFEWNVQTGVNTWTPEMEAMYGLTPGAFAKTQPAFESLVHRDDLAEVLRRVEQSFETAAPTEGEWRVAWPDGSVHWLAGRWQVFKDDSGKPLRMSGANIDITERKQAEEERERLLASEQQARQEADEANRMKDEFLATVSHELRTPLNSILGWANMLLRGGLDEQAAPRAIENIARGARAQNQLISDLLDVSRIITGKLRFEVGAVDLVPVIEAALETMRPAAEAKGVELRLTLDPAAGHVSGDADRLQQVVWNLLTNAVKYTPRGGHVETRLERQGTHAAIIVRDTGEGISADFLPYVFTRFRQADGATTRQHGGLGLGLAIVRHLVEAHGGQVSAASEGAGQGAAFTVTLPLRASRDADFGLRNEAAVDEQSAIITGLRVLVVEDDQDSRELLRLWLTQHGAEVRTGASAAEALDILKQGDQWRPEVLVSDIGMPDVDGYELMRQVRALPADRGGQVPAVALTGYAGPEDQRRVLAAGYQMFVPKPVELDELAAAIARLAAPRQVV